MATLVSIIEFLSSSSRFSVAVRFSVYRHVYTQQCKHIFSIFEYSLGLGVSRVHGVC